MDRSRKTGAAAVAVLLAVCAVGAVEFGPAGARAAVRASVNIYGMSPASGPAGTLVAITGFGFTDDNTIHFGARVIAHVAIHSAIGIACTSSPSCRSGIQQSLAFTVPEASPGATRVWVENANGRSAELQFVVVGGRSPGSADP